MSSDHYSPWEKELRAQAMDLELYLAGKRAGFVAASAEWPLVTSSPGEIRGKGVRATQELFGREGCARNTGYCAGWVAGYRARCEELARRDALAHRRS